jgi:hypothetical protein
MIFFKSPGTPRKGVIFPRERVPALVIQSECRQRDENEREKHALIIRRAAFLLILRDLLSTRVFSLSLIGRWQEYLFGCHKLSLLCIISFCLDLAASEESGVMGVHTLSLSLSLVHIHIDTPSQKRMEFLTSVPRQQQHARRQPASHLYNNVR